MPDTPPTPGEMAYSAYMAVHLAGNHIPKVAWSYGLLEPHERDGWEAAAQVVLAMEEKTHGKS